MVKKGGSLWLEIGISAQLITERFKWSQRISFSCVEAESVARILYLFNLCATYSHKCIFSSNGVLMKWLIGLMAMLSFNTFASDICLDWGSASSYNCSGYQYETLPVYFLDRHGVEQKFFAKKITRKSDGAFLHVDYEFHVKCTVNCGSGENARYQYLEDWKYALKNQATYNYEIISSCTRLTCDNVEPLSVDEISSDDVYASKGKVKIDLDSAESATTTVNNIVDTASTGSQIMNDLQKNNASASHPVSFITLVKGDNAYEDPVVCEVNSDGICKVISGRVVDNGNHFDAYYDKLSEQKANTIKDLFDRYLRDRPLQCKQTQTCSSGGLTKVKICTLSYTCWL